MKLAKIALAAGYLAIASFAGCGGSDATAPRAEDKEEAKKQNNAMNDYYKAHPPSKAKPK